MGRVYRNSRVRAGFDHTLFRESLFLVDSPIFLGSLVNGLKYKMDLIPRPYPKLTLLYCFILDRLGTMTM